MKIAGIPLDSSDVSWLEQIGRSGCTRTHLAERLCERKGIFDALGLPRIVAARIDIGRQAKRGALQIPPISREVDRTKSRRKKLNAGAPRLYELPRKTLEELGVLELKRVEGADDPLSAVWNDCLHEHHYLGAGPLCGAQLRYLVYARDQVVAALSFSAAARHVAARDKYIGWSQEALRKNRSLVIQQSRLCFTVLAKNLATRVQSLVLARVAEDWMKVYGYRPALAETYVNLQHFNGASYRAANWTHVGDTSGRGRQDARQLAEAGVKAIYVYPLEEGWKQRLCREPVIRLDPEKDWVETEWGGAPLGDFRRQERLLAYGRSCFEKPTASTPQACGDTAALKGAYRLLNHPRSTMDALLHPHREASLARAAEHSLVIAIEDTTSLNYSSHPATTGLGPITSTGGAHGTKGLQLHTCYLVSPQGVALGILDANCWARDVNSYGTKEKRAGDPISRKESHKWLRGFEAANEAAERLEKTQVVAVCDREADIYELLQFARKGRAQLLVRVNQPRRVLTLEGQLEGTLVDCLDAEPVARTIPLSIPRSGNRPARETRLDIRFREVRIAAPGYLSRRPERRRFVRAWAISATERTESAGGAEPVSWRLLTTRPVSTADEAIEKVAWYAKRWLIEVFHRTLKSGCKIEQRQSRRAETLQAALAVDMVVAWRVMHLTQLGREVPGIPCTAVFEDEEWQALYCFANKTSTPPSKPPPLNEIIRLLAMTLGGFLGRKGDGAPGAQVIWRGLERLADITAAYRLFVLKVEVVSRGPD